MTCACGMVTCAPTGEAEKRCDRCGQRKPVAAFPRRPGLDPSVHAHAECVSCGEVRTQRNERPLLQGDYDPVYRSVTKRAA